MLDQFRIRVELVDGSVSFSGDLGCDHEYADRLAKECKRDPVVRSVSVILVNEVGAVAEQFSC